MSFNYLYVLNIVVSVSSCDLIEKIEAFLELLIKLDVMNGTPHFFNFGR